MLKTNTNALDCAVSDMVRTLDDLHDFPNSEEILDALYGVCSNLERYIGEGWNPDLYKVEVDALENYVTALAPVARKILNLYANFK